MKSIVVFMQNRDFFGAQIIHVPLILELKNRYPEYKIILFAKYNIAKVLNGLDLVDEIFIENNKLSTLKKYIQLNPNLSISLRKNSLFTNLIISFFNRNEKIGFETLCTKIFFTKQKKYNKNIYRANNYLNLFDENIEFPLLTKANRISLIPGAGGEFKKWKLENYILLASKLKDEYPEYEVCFIVGEKEKSFLKFIPKEYNVYLNLDIKSLFNIIQESNIVVSNDCGPSHIAQISNVNTILLYSDEFNDAKSVIREWFNEKDGSYCIIGKTKQHIDSIDVDEVFEKANKILKEHKQ